MSKEKLLIVEDDIEITKQLKWAFVKDYDVITANSKQTAVSEFRRHEPKVVTLDINLQPHLNQLEGLSILSDLLAISPDVKIIMVTGNSSVDIAIKAIGLGAYDFYKKPIEVSELGLIIKRAFYLYNLEQERTIQDNNLSPFDNIIAHSPIMMGVCRTIQKVAPTDISTMLLGESGTGKELLAKALHNYSSRKNGPFVAINCGAIPENLLESELFGYERGAFTGAVKQTIGKIECAHKGTLFLDEIGDLPLPLQVKLLRFLQERVIERIGGRKLIQVDVRIISATHQDVQQLISNNSFREDLYYRLSEMDIKIPALKDRGTDIILLARVFIDKYAKEFKKSGLRLSDDAIIALESHSWPGNVRELENKIKRALIMADAKYISASDLELEVDKNNMPLNLRVVKERAEKEAINRALSYTNHNLSKAAMLLGLTRPTLYNLMDKLNIVSKKEQYEICIKE